MARQWRIEYPGAFYHVLSRGNDRQEVFRSDDDRKMFLGLIGEVSTRFQIDVLAYVLMGNHYHVLLKTGEGNLSKAMQWLGTTYTRKFNNRHDRSGHLFQGRYKSFLVENETYLLRLSCYIHRNPLRAGIVERLADYRKAPGWLKTDSILNLMAKGEDPHRQYRKKAQEYSAETVFIWEDVKHGLILGSDAFVTDIRARFLSDEIKPELPQHNRMIGQFSPREALERAAAALNFDLENALQNKRVPAGEKDKRDLMMFLLWKSGGLTNQEIGAYFGLTYSAVSRRVAKTGERLKQEKGLADLFEALKSQIKV